LSRSNSLARSLYQSITALIADWLAMTSSVHPDTEYVNPIAPLQKKLPSVNDLLNRLVLACMLPVFIAASVVIYFQFQESKKNQQLSSERLGRVTLLSVDAKLKHAISLAQRLSIDAQLEQGDFIGFYQTSKIFLIKNNLLDSVAVFDLKGVQKMNTTFPLGFILPPAGSMKKINEVLDTKSPSTPKLMSRTLDQKIIISFFVPVFVKGKIAYVLGVGVAPEKLIEILVGLSIDANASVFILDSAGKIAAVKSPAEVRVGESADADLLNHLKIEDVGAYSLKDSQGIPHQMVYSKSADSGWSIAFQLPQSTINTVIQREAFFVFLGALFLLFSSLFSAWRVGKKISHPLIAFQKAAFQWDTKSNLNLPETQLSEIQELSRSLKNLSVRLSQRSQQLQFSNQTLQERTLELTQAQHIAKMGSWSWNLISNSVKASDELLETFGPLIISPFAEKKGTLHSDTDWKKLLFHCKATLETGEEFSLLLIAFTKHKLPVWTRVNAAVSRDQSGIITGLVGTMQDVDKETQLALAASANQLRLEMALASSNAGLWEWEIQTGNLFFSPYSLTLLGHSVTDAPKQFSEFLTHVHFQDIEKLNSNLQLELVNGQDNGLFKLRYKYNSENFSWIEFSGQVIERNTQGLALRIIGLCKDITRHKLEDFAKEKSRLELESVLAWQVAQHTIAALAHQLNQPLASAAILCEVLDRTYQKNNSKSAIFFEENHTADIKSLTNEISNEIERAAQVLKVLMRSLEQPDTSRERIDIKKIINEKIININAYDLHSAVLSASFPHNFPLVSINALQIRKVLLNLIINSAQAMYLKNIQNGKIKITTDFSPDRGSVVISVHDEGPGISENWEEEIFQPFVSTKASGFGMGLTISRALISAHGGKLWVKRSHGIGAVVCFSLPFDPQ